MMSMRLGACTPLLAAVLATAFQALTIHPVQAQAWPAKPIRLVVPFPPGASNDVLSRITAQAMSPVLRTLQRRPYCKLQESRLLVLSVQTSYA